MEIPTRVSALDYFIFDLLIEDAEWRLRSHLSWAILYSIGSSNMFHSLGDRALSGLLDESLLLCEVLVQCVQHFLGFFYFNPVLLNPQWQVREDPSLAVILLFRIS